MRTLYSTESTQVTIKVIKEFLKAIPHAVNAILLFHFDLIELLL